MEATATRRLACTVAEALPRDVGRAIARMEPGDMAGLGLRSGDLVQVTGGRAAPARVMPAHPGSRAPGVAQVDGITRENARVGLGEAVEVSPVEVRQAERVSVAPVGRSGPPGGGEAGHLRQVLAGLPVATGDRVRATLIGGRFREFRVAGTEPEGMVLIGTGTRLRVQGEGAGGRGAVG